jgi:hypothetical protein
MPYFDRFDICAAWNLYLQHTHTGQGSRAYQRLSRLGTFFRPGHSQDTVTGLEENALAIYARLLRKDGLLAAPEYPVANSHSDGRELFLMWAGYERVYVWADHFDDAFEVLAEWCDDHAPGCLVSHEYFRELLAEAIQELYPAYVRYGTEKPGYGGTTYRPLDHSATVDAFLADHPLCETHEAEAVLTHAECDLTVIGHTSLKHGSHIGSDEWGGHEVTDANEVETVLLAELG